MRRLFPHAVALIPLYVFSVFLQTFAGAIPRPEDVFGFKPGADYKLAGYEQMLAYYRRLDASSDRIKVVEVGPTAQGRPMILAIISSEANMAELTKYRAISEKLARGRATEQEAIELARSGKSVIWIDGGLHASEVGHAQFSPELAFHMVSDESEQTRAIRDNVIFLQMPVMNPDGLDLVVDWYKRNLGTRFETSPLPELYHKYAGHDNNRDWYMMTQPETRNVSRLLYEIWYPQIVLNHHQTPPFPARIFIPPFTDPTNPNIPSLVMQGISSLAGAMGNRFLEEGKSGVVQRIEFDAWWNGGMRTTPCFHNMVGILAETALYNYATPYYYKSENIPARFKNGLSAQVASRDYPQPWKGGHWRLRDSIEYMKTASLAVLDMGAKHREDWLLNIYRMARESIERGKTSSPRAFLIAPDQHDPSAAVAMLEALHRGGIEIEQAQTPFLHGDRLYPQGTFVIRTAQAFRPHLVDLMESQHYPSRDADGSNGRPYDMTGWTLPLQMGVKVIRVEEELTAKTARVTAISLPAVSPLAPAESFLIDRRWNSSYQLVNQLLEAGVPVEVYAREVRVGEEIFPPGCFLVSAGYREQLGRLSAPLRVPVRPLAARPGGDWYEKLRQPRVGVHKSWVANADEGWTRWLLEQYQFPYRSLSDADIREGRLRENFDALILPSDTASHLVQGHSPSRMPPEFARGLGQLGLKHLREFAEAGGTLVAFDAACSVPLRFFDVPLTSSLERVSADEFSCPGSLVRLSVDPEDPLGYGMTEEAVACFAESQAFDLSTGPGLTSPGDADVQTIARYANKNLLMSGWMRGEEKIEGKRAVLRVRMGEGQIILVGFRPHFRGQSHGTFKLVFNSIYSAASDWSAGNRLARKSGD